VAKVFVKEQASYSLRLWLSKKEAIWLKGIVQNPLEEDESSEGNEVRKAIFEGLTKAGIKRLRY